MPEPGYSPGAAGLFDQAVAQHQAGRLVEAEALYRRLLQQQPNQPDAMHMLGVIAHQSGRNEEAVELIRKANAVGGGSAGSYSNLGVALRALGRLDEALAELQHALELAPSYVAAHKNLGVTFNDLGRFDEAAHHLRRTVELNPADTGAHKALGATLMKLGRVQEAADMFARATAARFDDPEAHNNLGVALKDLGRLDEAEQHLRRAIELAPQKAEAYNNLGLVFAARGLHREAAAEFRRAVGLAPAFALAYNNLGVSLKEMSNFEAALAALQQALKLQPNHVAALNNMGDVLNALARYDEAVAHLEKAVALDPRCHEAHNNLGVALNNLERPKEAARSLERSMELNPKYVPAHINLGNALVADGRIEEGTAHYMEALGLEPDSVAAYYSLATGSRRRFTEEDLARMESLAGRGRATSPDDKMLLYFSLAQAFDKAGRPDAAFTYCRQANELKRDHYRRQGIVFDPAAHVALVDRIISTFTPAFFGSVASWGSDSELPVFIVGMPRSGTTLVEQILSSHHAVFGAGELADVERIAAGLPATLGAPERYPECLLGASVEQVRSLAASHLDRLTGLGGDAERVVDKMTVNFLHLGLIAMLLPKARVLHCRRDPRDICVSCFFHNFARAGLCFAFDLAHLGVFYAQYERLMAHWRKVLPLRMIEVPYEELVHDQEAFTRKLVDFCGLDWDPNCLEFHKNPRPVKTASALQVRQPIYTSSVGRWESYQQYLRPFTERVSVE